MHVKNKINSMIERCGVTWAQGAEIKKNSGAIYVTRGSFIFGVGWFNTEEIALELFYHVSGCYLNNWIFMDCKGNYFIRSGHAHEILEHAQDEEPPTRTDDDIFFNLLIGRVITGNKESEVINYHRYMYESTTGTASNLHECIACGNNDFEVLKDCTVRCRACHSYVPRKE